MSEIKQVFKAFLFCLRDLQRVRKICAIAHAKAEQGESNSFNEEANFQYRFRSYFINDRKHIYNISNFT